MKPMRFVFIISFLIVLHSSFSQTLFTSEEMRMANTADTISYLTSEEKLVIQYMNLARLDGIKFYNSFISNYVSYHNRTYFPKLQANNKYLTSLKIDLQKVKNQKMMQPYKKLCQSAMYHAKDMGMAGTTGHDSSDGTECFDRIGNYFPELSCGAENCSYGHAEALHIVCSLLIDNNVSSLGHRINILKPNNILVGVGIAPHKVYKFNCVIDFCCDKL